MDLEEERADLAFRAAERRAALDAELSESSSDGWGLGTESSDEDSAAAHSILPESDVMRAAMGGL